MFFQKGDAYTGKITNRALTKQYGQGKNDENDVTVFNPSSYSCWFHMFSSTVQSAKEVPLHLASSNDIGFPNSAQSKSNLGAFTVHPSAKLSLETQESVVVCMCACMIKHHSNFKRLTFHMCYIFAESQKQTADAKKRTVAPPNCCRQLQVLHFLSKNLTTEGRKVPIVYITHRG